MGHYCEGPQEAGQAVSISGRYLQQGLSPVASLWLGSKRLAYQNPMSWVFFLMASNSLKLRWYEQVFLFYEDK